MEEPLIPIVFASVKNGSETVMLKALLYSGVGASLIAERHCDQLKTAQNKASFKTVAVYNMILGRDVLKSLGIILNHATETITWDVASIPMKATSEQTAGSFHM
eukprot:2122858-Ditylum_brightwellii.AAC.1